MLWSLLAGVGGTLIGALIPVTVHGRGEKILSALMAFTAGFMAALVFLDVMPESLESTGRIWVTLIVTLIGAGIVFLAGVLLDKKAGEHKHTDAEELPDLHSSEGKRELYVGFSLVTALVLHNIPEGMSLGLAFSIAALSQDPAALSSAFALALGMSIQNIPEGAAVSLPLACGTMSRAKAFAVGVFSGAMEPLFGVLTVLALSLVVPYLPWLLAFAAGAMMYVVVEELIPAAHLNEHSDLGTLSVMAGFVVMMLLDTTLG